MIELEEEHLEGGPAILVAGVGNAGCAVADRLTEWGGGAGLLMLDTDAASLRKLRCPVRMQLGSEALRGLGTADDPEKAEKAVFEDRERISGMLKGRDMVFVVAGLGGGVGTGAAPLVSAMASEAGALSVAVVTTPFLSEGRKRIENASSALKKLYSAADSLIVIPNEELFSQVAPGSLPEDAFRQAGGLILEAVKNICEIITKPGVFNVDLPRVRKMLYRSGIARFGVASAEGENRWARCLEKAMAFPLMQGTAPRDAESALLHITGGKDVTQDEIRKISDRLFAKAENLRVETGVTTDRKSSGKMKLWLLFAGIKTADPSALAGASAEGGIKGDLEGKLSGIRDEMEIPAILRRKKRRGYGIQ